MSSTPQLFYYFHTHWDREWYGAFRQYQQRLLLVLDDILEALNTQRIPSFVLDGQTVLLEDYLELRPHQKARLEGLIQSGQISIGPWFVMPDGFLVSGESLIRNLKRGIEASNALGCDRFTGYIPDSFGHPAAMPQLFQQFGIEHAVLWRGVGAETPAVFNWKTHPAGEPVVTYHLRQGYFQNALHDPALSNEEKISGLQSFVGPLLNPENHTAPLALLPIGADHLGLISPEQQALLKEAYPNARATTVADFMNVLKQSVGAEPLTSRSGDLYDRTPKAPFLLSGVFSSRLYLKQQNRRLEHQLAKVLEPLLALTQQLVGKEKRVLPEMQTSLDLAWKLLLLNHPHDSICGCSVDAVHRENEGRFDQVEQITTCLSRQLHEHVMAAVGLGRNQYLLCNWTDEPYTGVVSIEETAFETDPIWKQSVKNTAVKNSQVDRAESLLLDAYATDFRDLPMSDRLMMKTHRWAWVENLQPHSVTTVPQKSLSLPPQPVTVDPSHHRMQNGLLSVEITEAGTLTVTDLTTQTIYTGLHQLIDFPETGDSYNVGPVLGIQPTVAKPTEIRWEHTGPLVAVAHVAYQLGEAAQLLTHIKLCAGSRTIQFHTQWQNTTPDHKLQVAFDTGKSLDRVWHDGHFGLQENTFPYSAQPPELSLPVETGDEWLPKTGCMQRFVAGNGQALITKGLPEYEVRETKLCITLLRAFGMLSKKDTGTRGAHAGPALETPEGQCVGRSLTADYWWTSLQSDQPEQLVSLYPLADQCLGSVYGLSRFAGYTTEPETIPSSAQHSLVSWENPNVVSLSLRPSEDGIFLRLVNLRGQAETIVLKGYSSIQEAVWVDGLDHPLLDQQGIEAPQGETVVLTFSPNTLKTLWIRLR